MTSLADDLLKTKSIAVLRNLVASLENDANSKKTELQHMVGSKYHDFIQSADTITSMNERSAEVDKMMGEFSSSTRSLVQNISELLALADPSSATAKVKQHVIFSDFEGNNYNGNSFSVGCNLFALLSYNPLRFAQWSCVE
jgi:hypothetical protein